MIDMTIKKFSKARGFTLVELMIALAISLFLIGGVVLIQSSSRASSIEAERLSRLQENIRFTSDLLVRDIRNAGFRDQLSLTLPQFAEIGSPFAEITTIDGKETLEIRYAGWGSCADGFEVATSDDIPRVISNRYSVEDDQLTCSGSTAGDAPTSVSIASGINAVDYTLMCVSDTLTLIECTSCDLWADGSDFDDEFDKLQQACYGVQIGLEFEPADGAAGAPPVSVELNASFRNVLLGQMMWQSVCQINPTPDICNG